MKIRVFLFVLCFTSWLGGAVAKSFVIGELNGQLGNQCFEVAATLSLAWDHQAEATFPDFKTKTYFNIPANYEKVFWRLKTEQPKEKSEYRHVQTALPFAPIPYVPNMTLVGYFQSAKFFEKYKERICALLAPSSEILTYLKSKYSNIIEHPTSVGVHFRDYFKEDPFYGHRHGVPSKEYYKKAFAHFPKEALFVVFSDNIKWCKENLSDLAPNITFIENEGPHNDFYLMSLCKHTVLSNSTFSWWAAYLNQNPTKKVIAPKEWMLDTVNFDCKDVLPDEWITISIRG